MYFILIKTFINISLENGINQSTLAGQMVNKLPFKKD